MEDIDMKVERLLFNLNALTDLGEGISASKNLSADLKVALYMVMGTFAVSKGVLFKYDSETNGLNCLVSKGIEAAPDEIAIKLDKAALAELVIYCNKPVDVTGPKRPVALWARGGELLERIGARVVVPLTVKGELLGLIVINEKFSGEKFTSYDFRLMSVMALHIAVSLHNHSLLRKLVHKYNENQILYDNLNSIYQETIFAFSTAIDAKDAYTKGHSHRVSTYSSMLAAELGWGAKNVEGIRIAGLLHDIGKLAVDKTIINKSSQLTKHEFEEMYSHPVIGYDILSRIKFPWNDIQTTVRHHHEKIDGTGYPDNLKNDNIPTGAKVMSFVDAFDAMTTDRPYRQKLSLKQVMREIRKFYGVQFDPAIVVPFFTLLCREALGEVKRPVIIPLLTYEIGAKTVEDIVEIFPDVSL